MTVQQVPRFGSAPSPFSTGNSAQPRTASAPSFDQLAKSGTPVTASGWLQRSLDTRTGSRLSFDRQA